MLKVIKEAQEKHKMNIQSTYLCAHAVPIGADPEEMTKEIVEKHIPTVAQDGFQVWINPFDSFSTATYSTQNHN